MTLLESNPYLHDPAKRARMFAMTVTSSSAIEGVHLTTSDITKMKDGPPIKKVPKTRKK